MVVCGDNISRQPNQEQDGKGWWKDRKRGKDRKVRKDRKHGLELGDVDVEDLNDYISKQQFQFLNIWVLRDYLLHDMAIPDLDGEADLERLIDDFVFMCIFIGNDFLPHIPSLEISEGAIDLLMTVYKREFVRMGGYLTHSFEVNLKHVEHFIRILGSHENAIFRRRSELEKKRDRLFSNVPRLNLLPGGTKRKSNGFWHSFDFTPSTRPVLQSSDPKVIESPVDSATPDGADAVIDNIKLGEEGWKERYYAEKFEANTEDERGKFQKHAVLKYIEGICWVMRYYYQGVCSWQWFYPYHYAPFASDFYGLDHLDIHFTLGEPFKPFDQLMGVLPAASAHALPLFYRQLMTDPSSPILDFYPTDFELDMNGKRRSWMAICKLPFIKESRLLAEIAKVEHTLTDEEKQRNSLGVDVLFVHILHPLAAKIISFFQRNRDHPKLSEAKVKRKIDPKFSDGMNGFMYISDKPVWQLEINSPIEDMEIITRNEVISVFYRYPTSHPHIPRPPEGVAMPKPSVTKYDIAPEPTLWHAKTTMIERAPLGRPIPKCVSGSRLSKLAHWLVSKYYHKNKQTNMGTADLDINTVVDPISCQPKLVHGKEVEGDGRSCMNGTKPGKRKPRDLGDGQSIQCQLVSKEMIPAKEVDDYERICMTGTKSGKRKHMDADDGQSIKCQLNSREVVHCQSIECQLNSEDTIHAKVVDDAERSCMNGANPGKRKHTDVDNGQSIECQLNSKELVHEKEVVDERSSMNSQSIKCKKRRKSKGTTLEGPVLAC